MFVKLFKSCISTKFHVLFWFWISMSASSRDIGAFALRVIPAMSFSLSYFPMYANLLIINALFLHKCNFCATRPNFLTCHDEIKMNSIEICHQIAQDHFLQFLRQWLYIFLRSWQWTIMLMSLIDFKFSRVVRLCKIIYLDVVIKYSYRLCVFDLITLVSIFIDNMKKSAWCTINLTILVDS